MHYPLTAVATRVKPSAVREILKLTQNPDTISLAGGLPAEELFPRQALQEAFARLLQDNNRALQYGLTEGFTPLREVIAARMSQQGLPTSTADLLLTTGSQQALDLIARVLIEPGDAILVENPTYLAALQSFAFHGARAVAVATDDDGMDMADLQALIAREHPKFLYVTPTFANPTGRVWSEARRQELVAICRKAEVLIVEDDPYGAIRFSGTSRPTPLYAIDAAAGGGTVLYTSTFSKTVVPALRIGWVTGPAPVLSAMTRAKQAADLHSSSLDQQALYQLLTQFDLDHHITVICAEYERRMRHLHAALTAQQWPDVHWRKPAGGMFLWLRLPSAIDTEHLLQTAVQEGVAFVPGAEFYAGVPERNTLRLNYTHAGPERLSEAVTRLARALSTQTALR